MINCRAHNDSPDTFKSGIVKSCINFVDEKNFSFVQQYRCQYSQEFTESLTHHRYGNKRQFTQIGIDTWTIVKI